MSETITLTEEDAAEPAAACTDEPVLSEVEGAFAVSGFKAAVARPMFGQVHQQYFTPRWLCEALLPIAEHAFGLDEMLPEERPRLNVLDPTAGSARLLAPFKKAAHHVLGIEMDGRLAEVAARAVGKRSVRQGDLLAYASLIPENRWQVAAVNPPYGLWWPVDPDGPYSPYELVSGSSIESQHFVLELVTNLLAYQNGLLLAVLSGKFFDNHPRAAAFLHKHYQVVANVTLPRPFQAEYPGVEVDAAFVVAILDSPYGTQKKPVPLTGPFSGDGPALVDSVNAAFDQVKRNPYYRAYAPSGPGNPAVYPLHPQFRSDAPYVPDLEMAVAADTSSLPLNLTGRGVAARSDWSSAWFRLYNALPLQAYDAAQGTYAPLGEAYGSLPNVLMGGVAESRDRLTDLGFDVALTAHDAEQIERRARRFERDRLPVRELEPMEFLAYFADGSITARQSAALPDGTPIPAGATYDLRGRWFRRDEQVGEGVEKGEGKKSYVQRTFVDRGYLVLRFTPATPTHEGVELKPFVVEEVNPDAVKALVDAFGLPQVPTVDDRPELPGWERRLERFMDRHQEAAQGRRLYPTQAKDVARMACKPAVALLYEQGAGKTTTMAHWAALRGYRTALIVTPASVAPGILEDLANWGFPAERLEHSTVSRLLAEKRQHRLARARVQTARQRVATLQARLAELLALDASRGAMQARSREWGLPAGASPSLRDPSSALRAGPSAALWAGLDQVVKEKATALEARLRPEEAILLGDAERVQLEAELARKRRHLRNLLAIRRKGKAGNAQHIQTEIAEAGWAVEQLTGQLRSTHAALYDTYEARRDVPQFYVTSYQDLSLGDHVGLFDPWDHDHFDRQGKYEGTVRGLRGAHCTCDAPRM